MGQTAGNLVNTKTAGKWMSIPRKSGRSLGPCHHIIRVQQRAWPTRKSTPMVGLCISKQGNSFRHVCRLILGAFIGILVTSVSQWFFDPTRADWPITSSVGPGCVPTPHASFNENQLACGVIRPLNSQIQHHNRGPFDWTNLWGKNKKLSSAGWYTRNLPSSCSNYLATNQMNLQPFGCESRHWNISHLYIVQSSAELFWMINSDHQAIVILLIRLRYIWIYLKTRCA